MASGQLHNMREPRRGCSLLLACTAERRLHLVQMRTLYTAAGQGGMLLWRKMQELAEKPACLSICLAEGVQCLHMCFCFCTCEGEQMRQILQSEAPSLSVSYGLSPTLCLLLLLTCYKMFRCPLHDLYFKVIFGC